MALDNKLVNSINSPRIMRSLTRGGTGGSDDWTAVGCICVCPEIACVVIGCMCVDMRLPTVLVMAGRLIVGASTKSEAAESSSSASGVSLSALGELFDGLFWLVVGIALLAC